MSKTYYQTLGLDQKATAEQIQEAYNKRAAAEKDTAELKEIALAYNILRNENLRKIYDASLVSHYNVLGVNKDATEGEINKSYRKLALEFHPDKAELKGYDKNAAEAIFKIVTEAHGTLADPDKRKTYDLEQTGAQQQSTSQNTQAKAKTQTNYSESQSKPSFRPTEPKFRAYTQPENDSTPSFSSRNQAKTSSNFFTFQPEPRPSFNQDDSFILLLRFSMAMSAAVAMERQRQIQMQILKQQMEALILLTLIASAMKLQAEKNLEGQNFNVPIFGAMGR